MLWKNREGSDNVEDRRGMSPRGLAVGGGLGTVVLVLIVALLGGDPKKVLDQIQGNGPQVEQRQGAPAEDE